MKIIYRQHDIINGLVLDAEPFQVLELPSEAR